MPETRITLSCDEKCYILHKMYTFTPIIVVKLGPV